MNNMKIYLWIQHYKEIGLSILPKDKQFDNIFRERMLDMSKDNLLCFRRVVCVFIEVSHSRWPRVE